MFSKMMNFSQYVIDILSDFGTQIYDFMFTTVNIDVLGIETSVFTLMFGSAFFIWATVRIVKAIV